MEHMWLKGEGKGFPVHAMQVYGEGER